MTVERFLDKFIISLRFLLVLSLLTGVIYPLLVTGIAQTVFPKQANGSMILSADGKIQGSELIGQEFTSPGYFWGRISATPEYPYNSMLSSGTNYSFMNPGVKDNAEKRIELLKNAGHMPNDALPLDLITASGSGLDPHISVASAEFQAPRVAAARKISEAKIKEYIAANTEERFLGFLGEKRVNVLKLNIMIDKEAALKGKQSSVERQSKGKNQATKGR